MTMIELKNFETKIVTGGMYYTLLGATLGAVSLAGWAASLASREHFAKGGLESVFQISFIFGAIGATFGSVVGLCIDKIAGNSP